MNKQTLRNIVLCGVFSVPFIPFLVSSSFFFPFITPKAFFWRILVEIVFAIWVLLALKHKEYRPRKTPTLSAVGAFLLVIALANIFGTSPMASFWSNFERMDGFVSLLHLGAFFVVMSSVMTKDLWSKWWNTSLIASALMVLFALCQLAGLFTINQGGARVDGTFGNAIYLAVYMLIHIFISGFMLLSTRNSTIKWVYGILAVLQATILYYTATRGAILGLIGGVIVFALLNLKNRDDKMLQKLSLGLVVALVVVIGGFLVARDSSFVSNSPVLSRFASLNISELRSQGRYFVWPMAWEGFKEHPILGWGQENFQYVFQKYYRPEMYKLEPWFDRAHNIFLDWMVAGGVLGLASYLALYAVPLYLLWRRKESFTLLERSIFVSLISAYFFHNVFVFDHLVSYIFFFSILAYINSRDSSEEYLWDTKLDEGVSEKIALGLISIALISTVYYVNIRPMKTNFALIGALNAIQVRDYSAASKEFQRSYNKTYLGQIEASEQIGRNSIAILTGDIPMEEKNSFYEFTTKTLVDQANLRKDSTRTLLLVGSYMSSVGRFEDALTLLQAANSISPGKLDILFEIGSIYINLKKPEEAMAIFKKAYDMAPGYTEGNIIYLIGSIYTGDRSVEERLLSSLSRRAVAFDDRIINAYFANRRFDRVEFLINERKSIDPANISTYEKYLEELNKFR